MASTITLITVALVLVTTFEISLAGKKETATINTPSGPIKGLKTVAPYTKDTTHQFRRIPYAKPPVGELRFRNPVPYGSWNEVLDATKYGPSCMQPMAEELMEYELPNLEISEDCLFLNIFVPHNLERENKLPVMVDIHGGGFIYGQGMFDDASDLATFGNVIVVTMNYRLGVFGFLSMDHPASLGNYGLWDQKMALEWVNRNIEAFGGDPNEVTIFGESAGGISVHIHSLIPSNKGLFQRAIAQSGTIYSGFALSKSSRELSEITGKNVGCEVKNNKDIKKFMDCLRQKSKEDIMAAADLMNFIDPSELVLQYGFVPIVDGILIPDLPENIVTDYRPDIVEFYQSVDLIVGTTSHEGSLLFYYLMSPELLERYKINVTEGLSTSFVCDVLGKAAVHEMYGKSDEAVKAVCDFYSDPSSPVNQGRRAVDLMGDYFFVGGASLAADLHSKGNPRTNTYRYTYSALSPVPFVSYGPAWHEACGHGDELIAVFGPKYAMAKGQEIPKDYKLLSEKTQTYWTNFAKSGNPNKPSSTIEIPQWPAYDNIKQPNLNINHDIRVENHASAGAYDLWIKKVPEIMRKGETKDQREEL